MSLATFIQASAHDMPQVATGSVQCIVTSPPYYGLRKYEGVQDVDWPAVEYAPMPGLAPLTVPPMRSPLGNEPTIEAYIAHLVLCLREWRRVLRDDGVCFVNLGDSYVSGNSEQVIQTKDRGRNTARSVTNFYSRPKSDLPAKNLMMVPARFALAAQADGWWLRSDIIGAKVAPMPESVTDRPTRSHEHIWMLTKAARYYWDAEAVREAYTEEKGGRVIGRGIHGSNQARGNDLSNIGGYPQTHAGRNMRDVIEWRPAPFSGSHFAVFPEAIPERFIRAATSERGACPHCGAPWARVVEREKAEYKPCGGAYAERHIQQSKGKTRSQAGGMPIDTVQTVGFTPTCTCPAADPVPCVVLDPFSGSGTTAKVAVRLGRRAIGVDISSEYLADVTAQRFGAGVQMELTGA